MRVPSKVKEPIIVVATAFILFAIIMAFVIADSAREVDGGHVQRIMYFHVASAWISYVAFKDLKWDIPAFSSAQLGVVFCTLAITTGPMWAKATWGVYWRWEDLKLLMTLVLWLIFIAYLVLRANVQSKRTKADLSAAFSILGFLCIPLSAAANRIWQQSHPTVVATDSGGLAPSMGAALGISVLAFTFLYVALLTMKLENETLKITVEDLKERIGDTDG